jgi:hypothetical protein
MILTKELERAERERFWNEFAHVIWRITFWILSVVTAFTWGVLAA